MAGFLIIVMATSYYAPMLARAQTSDQERCDTDICNVTITKNGFVPKTLIVKIGTTIVWTNTDDKSHTVTSGIPGEITPPLNSKLLEKGDTYQFTFEYGGFYKGTYQYFDQVTRIMTGQITVEPASKTETITKVQTISIDFSDPNSGVKKISLSTGTIKSMQLDPAAHSLIINLGGVQTIGNLEITLDRHLIDARTNDTDTSFMILVTQVSSTEYQGFYDEMSSTPTERTLRIVVPDTTTQIKIVGTQAIPEFPFALLAITAVFTAMIVGYRLRPRF